MDELLRKVKARVEELGLSLKDAADQIGVTVTSLQRHLGGEYVRSDSLAKYRGWLDGRRATSRPVQQVIQSLLPPGSEDDRDVGGIGSVRIVCPPFRRSKPYKVVDLFSGCGGMSLGFDLLSPEALVEADPDGLALPGERAVKAGVFETVLALDIEAKVVDIQNKNHLAAGALQGYPARCVSLADFQNACEMLAYYLDHLANRSGDRDLRAGLNALSRLPLAEFKALVRRLDTHFLAALERRRADARFRHEYGEVDSTVFGQTSVVGFHEALALPQTSTSKPSLGPLVWADHGGSSAEALSLPDLARLHGYERAHAEATESADALWEGELAKLVGRTEGKGRGQLASSAGRIRRFTEFLKTEPMKQVKAAWLAWRAARDALRLVTFSDPGVEAGLRELYSADRRVDVLLGGPPCQGFSRIGRGKIRSLREHHVHVETDPEAGDVRNLLLLRYVEFVSALEPRFFMFENVRHFQASVKTPEGEFLATEVLNDAIQELSQHRVSYRVRDRVVDCSRHLIPQTRERFVMVGVRTDISHPACAAELLPDWCLDLPVLPPVPLRAALEGLPAPLVARGQRAGEVAGMSATVRVTGEGVGAAVQGPSSVYLRWVRQVSGSGTDGEANTQTDAHFIRDPRADDQAFFALLGPGERWMDYRCDQSPTLLALRQTLEALRGLFPDDAEDGQVLTGAGGTATFDRATVERLLACLDGSLSIRLLLESIPPRDGELHHHLLTTNYLAKREGNNGDWIARLHPDRPCKTVVSHMAKDTYAYVHPWEPRTLSVREAARLQTFPDWFRFGELGLVDAFRAVGNAVPPLLSYQFGMKVGRLLWACEAAGRAHEARETAAHLNGVQAAG